MPTAFDKTSSHSDKIHHHAYQRFYPRFLDGYQNREIQMLEIGIDREESMKLWSEYLPNATIHGIDIKKYSSSERVTMHQVDQSSAEQLEEFSSNFQGSFDFIIDDGSHVPEHQILTLNKLWTCLKPGGIFIIEDVETNFWGKSSCYGYKFDSRRINLITYLTQAILNINSEFQSKPPRKHHLFDGIETLSFGQNCVILEKKDPSNDRFHSRAYRFSSHLNHRLLRKRIYTAIVLVKQGHPKAAFRALFRSSLES